MLGPIASKLRPYASVPRAGLRVGIAASILFIGCESLQDAVANGDTRTITMHHIHTKETITVTFKRNGRYDPVAQKKLNRFLRDWRHHTETKMDPRLVDLIWEVDREVGGTKPVEVIGGYRDPSTNSMLRRRSSGVAQNSLHMHGKAMDFFVPGVPLEKLRVAGLRLQRGGVGFYPRSGSPFVHMDVGGVRHWPRMTRQQLARVFPDGRTVHIPSDGKPLSGYRLALADVQRRGSNPSHMSIAAARNAGIDADAQPAAPARNLFASLFSSKEDEKADEAKPAKQPEPVRVAEASVTPADPVPLPKTRPERQVPVVVASAFAPSRPAPADQPTQGMTLASVSASLSPSPSDIIRTRGYWVGVPDAVPQNAAARTTLAARMTGRSADPVTTGSLPSELQPPSSNTAADQRLAYAPFAERYAVVTRQARRTVVMRSTETATSVAVKAGAGGRLTTALMQTFDPWLNAVTITPSVRRYLASTHYGRRDFLSLRPYFKKPVTTVDMAFSDDPHHGLSAERFEGRAIVFVSTVAFIGKPVGILGQTASLY